MVYQDGELIQSGLVAWLYLPDPVRHRRQFLVRTSKAPSMSLGVEGILILGSPSTAMDSSIPVEITAFRSESTVSRFRVKGIISDIGDWYNSLKKPKKRVYSGIWCFFTTCGIVDDSAAGLLAL